MPPIAFINKIKRRSISKRSQSLTYVLRISRSVKNVIGWVIKETRKKELRNAVDFRAITNENHIAIVTVFAPAVLSMYKSKTVPATAPNAAPNSVPVGRVIVVAAADVDVMYPVATSAAVAVAVELIAAEVECVTNCVFALVNTGSTGAAVKVATPVTARVLESVVAPVTAKVLPKSTAVSVLRPWNFTTGT